MILGESHELEHRRAESMNLSYVRTATEVLMMPCCYANGQVNTDIRDL